MSYILQPRIQRWSIFLSYAVLECLRSFFYGSALQIRFVSLPHKLVLLCICYISTIVLAFDWHATKAAHTHTVQYCLFRSLFRNIRQCHFPTFPCTLGWICWLPNEVHPTSQQRFGLYLLLLDILVVGRVGTFTPSKKHSALSPFARLWPIDSERWCTYHLLPFFYMSCRAIFTMFYDKSIIKCLFPWLSVTLLASVYVCVSVYKWGLCEGDGFHAIRGEVPVLGLLGIWGFARLLHGYFGHIPLSDVELQSFSS